MERQQDTTTGSMPAGARPRGDSTGVATPADDALKGVVHGLLRDLAKALRAYHLYGGENPAYRRFRLAAASAFAEYWTWKDDLELVVTETSIAWNGETIYESDNRAESLAFLLSKDGLRGVHVLPGFEQTELDSLMTVLHAAQYQPSEEDDLLTLLWQTEFSRLRYDAVSLFAEGLDIPEPTNEPPFDVKLVTQLAQEQVRGRPRGTDLTDKAAAASTIRSVDPAAYVLNPADVQHIHDELRLERERELSRHIIGALLDSVEAQTPDRQSRILRMFPTVLSTLLRRGEVELTGQALRELDRLAAQEGVLDDARRGELQTVLDEVSGSDAVRRLVTSMAEGSVRASPHDLEDLLHRLRPPALPTLLSPLNRMENVELRKLLEKAARTIAEGNPARLLELLHVDDAEVVVGAALVATSLKLQGIGAELAHLIEHRDLTVRVVAVRGLAMLGDTAWVPALQRALRDANREVRVTAVRALGSMRDPSSESVLRPLILGQEMSTADLTEKIAFFEAYGTLGSPSCVSVLMDVLAGRGLLGPKHPGEVRACAALGLGRIKTPQAQRALERAAADKDPVVRSAATRALRGGTA
ncbi:MAG: HEAT repeat domain-containing protein [Gemmatimonadetes bacterium]|nr:HEAT repeat domain-containing protein [Gemmatimonadota bacterium]